MKTIIEWLDKLPEPYRSAAKRNCIPGKKDREVGSLSWALDDAFIWGNSSEGHGFWAEVYLAIYRIKPFPPFPRATEKTIIEWLDELPEPHRSAAKRNCDQAGKYDRKVSLPEALRGAFIWHRSSEGHDFWSEVRQALSLGKPLPPFPRATEKTIIEWLDELPEPYRSAAKKNCITEKKDQEVNSLSWAIHLGFNWGASPEGEDFWAEVCQALEQNKPLPPFPGSVSTLPDSGSRSLFSTGAVRDTASGKGVPSRIPPDAIRRLAKRYEDGESKYPNAADGTPNWMLGIPLSRFQDAIVRHALAAAEGDKSEDHLAAVMWNAAGWMWTEGAIASGRLPGTLDDLPFSGKDRTEPDKPETARSGLPVRIRLVEDSTVHDTLLTGISNVRGQSLYKTAAGTFNQNEISSITTAP